MKFIIICIVILFVGGIIEGIAEQFGKNKDDSESDEMPFNYRKSPYTPEWDRPFYTCKGCVNCRLLSDQKRYGCKLNNVYVDPNYVCDDYIELDLFRNWANPNDGWTPYRGHFDHCPSKHKNTK